MTDDDRDLAALLAAVDDDQPGALGLLADLLEERQDPRAAGLRQVPHRKAPHRVGGFWYWERREPGEAYYAHSLVTAVFEELPGLDALPRPGLGERLARYPTRSAAYLALAHALASA